MTNLSVTDRQDPPNNRPRTRRSARVWIGLSFLVSSIILLWAFTLPFRGSMTSVKATEQASVARTGASLTAGQRQTEAEAFREQAIAQHHDFLESLRRQKQIRADRKLPDTQEANQRWSQRVEQMERELKVLDTRIQRSDAPEGSMLRENRKYLMRILADQPH